MIRGFIIGLLNNTWLSEAATKFPLKNEVKGIVNHFAKTYPHGNGEKKFLYSNTMAAGKDLDSKIISNIE